MLWFVALGALAHPPEPSVDFPDVPGAVTLVCDLHMHTVFSDGYVWPNLRTLEAEREGLDCIATTEHLEYQPFAADIRHRDRNRAHQVAEAAKSEGSTLMVINGSEITRDMPPGHANAVFVTDANRLLKRKALDAFAEADRQGAFVFLNHPNWTAQRFDGIARLEPMHLDLLERGWVHGIEVVNDTTFSDEALQIALDHDLAILANSDIHGLVDWQYQLPAGGHRPATLVFAEARTPAALRKALFERRTVAWFEGSLIGRPDVLMPLIEASLTVASTSWMRDVLVVELANQSDAPMVLRNRSELGLHNSIGVVTVPAMGKTTVMIKPTERVASLSVPFEVLSAVTAPGTHPTYTLELSDLPTE
ncbi:MAG: hypothetical protein KTR31_03010 [Myxococcales bacterium]|nr:hypothetical protein [Myxococcales bacterium]